jgi:hypothetical protein
MPVAPCFFVLKKAAQKPPLSGSSHWQGYCLPSSSFTKVPG